MSVENRIVVLIDMDCFYCQVEEKLNPELKGKPIAVVQYNPWKGGGIIAVNYVARAMGVTRHMRGDEAKEKCPEIELPSVPCQRGKADITKYRDAGKDVAKVLQKFTSLLERASVDEAYLDITSAVQERLKSLSVHSVTMEMLTNTYVLGCDSLKHFLNDVQDYCNDSIDFDSEHAKQLLIGAVIVNEMRAAVYNETGYQCSAGIAHNKILAKLVCGMNKPNKQTVLPKHSIDILYRTLPVKKVRNLGGKFGDNVCEVLKISKMGELQMFSEKELQMKFEEKNGSWLYNIARGIDLEPVQAKFNPKSIGCCKQFRGKAALLDLLSLKKWLKDLGDEIEDRLEKDALENNRTPKQMVVSFASQLSDKDVSSSRSYNFSNEEELCGELFYTKAFDLIMESTEAIKPKDLQDNEENRKLTAPIKFLGISVGKFEDNCENKKTKRIVDYFAAGTSKSIDNADNSDVKQKISVHTKRKPDKDYIMNKFFKLTDKNNEEKENLNQAGIEVIKLPSPNGNIESNLDKQESFFANYLKNNLKEIPRKQVNSKCNAFDKIRPMTPLCIVDECKNDSNDSTYSGSTINLEINKSLSLQDDNSKDATRISDMRNLLNHSHVENTSTSTSEEHSNDKEIASNSPIIGSVVCPECKKNVPLSELDTHSDYHLAMQLRNEERRIAKRENKEKINNKDNPKNSLESKQVQVSSLSKFIIKLDESVPVKTCTDCGKKVPIDKFSEHLDFHEAQRISKELNKKSTPIHVVNSVKRKRKTVSSPAKKSKLPCKSIDSFFR